MKTKLPYVVLHPLLRAHTLEVIRQTHIAKELLPDLNNALTFKDSIRAFSILQTMVSVLSVITAILFQSGGDGQERSEWLQACFGLQRTKYDKKNLLRDFRNSLMHLDDRIDKHFMGKVTERSNENLKGDKLFIAVDRFIDGAHGEDIASYFDNETNDFYLMKSKLPLKLLTEAILEFNTRAEIVVDEQRISKLITGSKVEVHVFAFTEIILYSLVSG